MNDQLPPYCQIAEMGVLGCLLLDATEVLPAISRLNPEAFYDLRNREVFNLAMKISAEGKPVDKLSISIAAREAGVDFGGISYLNECENNAPTAQNLSYHLPVVMEKHLRRRIIKGCDLISSQAHNGSGIDTVLGTVNRLVELEKPGAMQVENGREAGGRMINDLERRHQLQGDLSGLDSGFYRLNDLTCGLQFGEQTLIGARPSQGKTALGLNIFQRTAIHHKIPALFVSLEMSTEALMRRLLASQCSIPMDTIRKGSYSESDFAAMSQFNLLVGRSPMFILDAVSGINISELGTQIIRHVKKHGIKLVVIDYLQKIKASVKSEKRTYEVGEVSERLKALAVETKAAFLTLAQLSRESEKDKGRPPRMSDLADSGQIERDADTIILIHRNRSDEAMEAKLIVAKQRDGETGTVGLQFNGKYCRFENPAFAHD